MEKRTLLFIALALALAARSGTTLADPTDEHHAASGIHEVADDELADMRGRYVVGDNTVLWFGVQMISTWQTSNGQTLQSTLTLGLDFSKNPNQPQVKFVPTVTISTLSNAPLPSVSPSSISRSIQSAGLANVGGLTQSVQIAGDNNAAGNIASLNIQNVGAATLSLTGGDNNAGTAGASSNGNNNASAANTTNTTSLDVAGPSVNASSSTSGPNAGSPSSEGGRVAVTASIPSVTTTGVNGPNGRYASVGGASASSTYSSDGAAVNLSVNGQGSVSQWIRQGSLGQTIALTADNQVATNQMIVSLVTQSVSGATSQLAHNLAQSLNLNRINR
ncbi:MAG TPA: hypothetical protein VL997_13300 [Dyella sp.]|nr:hypothetical protein [Dyella sp.]